MDVATLKKIALETKTARNNIQGYKLKNGNWIYVIAEGRLVNLAAGDGHPAEIMDMSFAIQALSALHLVKNKGKLTEKIIEPMWYNELYMNFCGEELLEWITALSNLPFTIIPIFIR